MMSPSGLSRRGLLAALGALFTGAVGLLLAVPIVGYILSPVIRERKPGYESWLSARPAQSVSGGRDAPRDLSKSGGQSNGWGNREYSLLGTEYRRPEVPGLCHQLRASGLPRSLVPAVRPVHVPLPRRRLLRGRFPCRRTSAAWTLHLFLQAAARQLMDQRGRDAHYRIPNREADQHHRGAAMRLIRKLGDWFDRRLALATPIRETMQHPVPRETASWSYVFGSAALTVFALQLVTGILLALLYVPSAGEAWNSLQMLNHQVTLGWFIRALHGWGSNFMVAIVLIHMVQVFLFGAYKFPRELTWIVGVFLLLLTLGMAFTGQVLRFDQDAYWGLGIGASICQPHTRPRAVGREPPCWEDRS